MAENYIAVKTNKNIKKQCFILLREIDVCDGS